MSGTCKCVRSCVPAALSCQAAPLARNGGGGGRVPVKRGQRASDSPSEQVPICGWEKELETRRFSIWLSLSGERESGCVPTASEDPAEPKGGPVHGWRCPLQSIDLPRYSNLVSRLFILPFTPHPIPSPASGPFLGWAFL